MKEEELKKIIVDCESNIYTLEDEKEKDEKLNAAKAIIMIVIFFIVICLFKNVT